MTIDAWRPGRDSNGWRLAETLWKGMEKADEEWNETDMEELEVPIEVKAVPRFADDIKALLQLTKATEPPLK